MAAKMSRCFGRGLAFGFWRVQDKRCPFLLTRIFAPVYMSRQHIATDHHTVDKQFDAITGPALNLVFKFGVSNFKEIVEPTVHRPRIYDDPGRLPFGVPMMPFQESFELPSSIKSTLENVIDDIMEKEEVLASSLIKIRRKKMNKHKYKKRIDRDIAKIRKIRNFRLRKKRRRQAHKKRLLVKKLDRILDKNPKSDLPTRPYIIYRLQKW